MLRLFPVVYCASVALAKFKLDQQSRQQALRAYCPDIYTVTKGQEEGARMSF